MHVRQVVALPVEALQGCRLMCGAYICRLEKLLAAERALDTVVWQLLASVICPGYTIHTVVALAHAGLLPLEVGILQSNGQLAGQAICTAVCGSLSSGHLPFDVPVYSLFEIVLVVLYSEWSR